MRNAQATRWDAHNTGDAARLAASRPPSRTLAHLANEIPHADAAFASIIGESLAVQAAIALSRRVADHPTTTVLLHGETGTGKELFARGIHYAGPSALEPFVAINCSAIPENLLESELFGHEPGAFTDARSLKRGLFELAGRGTVFLDEINELPVKLQPKLLRALENRRVRRLGGLHEYELECRIVAATNADLSTAVASGQFRVDLYYRLSVFRIELPALRMRHGDIELLAKHFVAGICQEQGISLKTIGAAAFDLLRAHPWPGNIRELKNTMERAVIVSEGDGIGREHIVLQRRTEMPGGQSGRKDVVGSIDVPVEGLSLAEAERQLFELTLRITGNNNTRAARLLGISRPTMLAKIRLYGLKR